MQRIMLIRRISFFAGLFIFSSIASAQYLDFALTGGYSHFFPEHTGDLFFNKDGAYIDGNFAYRLPGSPVPIYAGFGITASGYWDSEQTPFFNNGFYYNNNNLYSDIEMVEAEPRVAVKLLVPGLPGFYVRPQLGAGLLINNYSVDMLQQNNSLFYIHTAYFTGAAFDIRPDVEAGWSIGGRTSVGLDLSYMAAFGNFGQMGTVMQELRVGLFARFRY
jgi:hypothetical protein